MRKPALGGPLGSRCFAEQATYEHWVFKKYLYVSSNVSIIIQYLYSGISINYEQYNTQNLYYYKRSPHVWE